MTHFLPRWDELAPFSTEIALVLAMLAVLVTPMFSFRRKILHVAIAAATGLGIALLAAIFTRGLAVSSPAVYFGGLLMHDPFAWVARLLVIGALCAVMALWYADSHDKFIARGQTQDASEFFALMFASAVGLCVLTATTHLLVILIAMELVTLPMYVLVGFRKNLRQSAGAATRFILFGCGATAVMLYGMSLLYGLFGTLDLQTIGTLLRDSKRVLELQGATGVAAIAGLIAVLFGPLFKIVLAPLHSWFADVCGGGTIDVATFVSLSFPTAGLAMLLRIVLALVGPGGAADHLSWLPAALLGVGAVATLWGAVGALGQNNIKRLLAWSTMTHVGFILIAMVAVISPSDGTHSLAPFGWKLMASRAAEALLLYLFLLLFMNGGAFIAAASIAQRLTGPADAGMSLGVERFTPAAPPQGPNGFVAAATGEQLSDYTALSRRAPILAATMLIFLLALAGLPFTVGFSARTKLITTLFESGNMLAWVGMAVIAVGTVASAFAYLRVIRQMYFVESENPGLIEIAPVTIVGIVLLVPTVALFVAYGWMDREAQRHGQLLTPPEVKESPRPADGLFWWK